MSVLIGVQGAGGNGPSRWFGAADNAIDRATETHYCLHSCVSYLSGDV